MKPIILIFFLFIAVSCLGQDDDMVSSFKPKTRTEKLVFAKLKALPEVKDFYAAVKAKKDHPDIVINPPDKFHKDYSFQVGVLQPEVFRTYFWLVINPKTLNVYYEDFSSEGLMDVPIETWRYWENRPELQKSHKWVHGKLVVLENKPHAKKKSS